MRWSKGDPKKKVSLLGSLILTDMHWRLSFSSVNVPSRMLSSCAHSADKPAPLTSEPQSGFAAEPQSGVFWLRQMTWDCIEAPQ